jgi:serine/threonine protein kinase
MGNTNYRMAGVLAPPDPRGYLQADFPKFIFQGKIGNAKFMKTYHMKADGVALVLKVYMRLTDEDLAAVAARLTHLSKVLSPMKYPCLMPYQMWLKSSSRIGRNSPYSPVYLVRQHIKSSLYDRLATRPFLNKMEKLWLIYQLLRAVECVHEEDVIHGDIKPENIMVTSWNWLMLTDFASFKPLTIPDDDPTDFQYYFDVSERRRCYVAPERFVKRSSVKRAPDGMANTTTNATASSQSGADTFTDLRLLENDGVAFWASSSLCSDPYELSLLKAMDVFSLGCTIAEVCLHPSIHPSSGYDIFLMYASPSLTFFASMILDSAGRRALHRPTGPTKLSQQHRHTAP